MQNGKESDLELPGPDRIGRRLQHDELQRYIEQKHVPDVLTREFPTKS
jgi:hypothetical protein